MAFTLKYRLKKVDILSTTAHYWLENLSLCVILQKVFAVSESLVQHLTGFDDIKSKETTEIFYILIRE